MADPAAAAGSDGGLSGVAREFWQGVARPNFPAVCAALVLVAFAWLAVIAGSTSAHVRRTPAEQWLRNPLDDYGLLSARCIQGAGRHAQGRDTIVFVGSSLVREALPDERTLSAILSEHRAAPVRALKLCGNSLGVIDAAAVIDKFGADFRGVFVLALNRHLLDRGLDRAVAAREDTDGALGFASPIWEEELRRAGVVPPRRIGWDFWDDHAFYIRTMGGWRHAWGKQPELLPHFFTPGRAPSVERIRKVVPQEDSRARAEYLGVAARIAERLRAAGGARLVVMEFPWADHATPVMQDAAWRAAEERHAAEMRSWSRENRVPWIDVRGELQLQPDDFCDVVHITNPVVHERFARAVAAPLHASLP